MQETFYNLFTEHNEDWIKDAYHYGDFNYPVGMQRIRILNRILDRYDLENATALDIGCGGGDITIALASRGCQVMSIDMSERMLETARERVNALGLSDKVVLRKENLECLSREVTQKKYDIIIAFGVIGYLQDDDTLFKSVDPIIAPSGLFLFSCRNRLFNMTSISPNTVREIQTGNAENLIEDMDQYYEKQLDKATVKEFIKRLREACDDIDEALDRYDSWTIPEKNFNERKGAEQPRQSTPMGIAELADKYAYEHKNSFGVHPHLLLPRSNTIFPPEVFNRLSDALLVFEDQPISMIWSSVFICELVKKANRG